MTPWIAVVVATPEGFPLIRPVAVCLRAQTIRERIELLIVTPSAAAIDAGPEELEGFHSVRVVEAGPFLSTGHAKAAGVRAATAPLVAFIEEHSHPAPGWAESFVRAHGGPWAAVGPSVVNPNPKLAISWAQLLMEYGPWIAPAAAGEQAFLPGNNSCYKRDLLLHYGERLESCLQVEYVLHRDMIAKGHRLYLEPAAVTYHLNVSRASSFLKVTFLSSRAFAAARARNWPVPKRLAMAAASVLIPAVRLRRILATIRRIGRWKELAPRALPWTAAGLIVSATGEILGYLAGEGRSARYLMDVEFGRERHLAQGDCRTVFP